MHSTRASSRCTPSGRSWEPRELPDEQTRELRALLLRRAELVEMLVMEKNRLEHAPQRLRREVLNGHIDASPPSGSSAWTTTSTRW